MIKGFIYPFVLASILAFLLFGFGCEGGYQAKGTVYEWINAPQDAKGTIYIQKSIPNDIAVAPISFANIHIWFKTENNIDPEYGEVTHTDEKGKYVISTNACASGIHMIKIDKEGYNTATGEFYIDPNKPNPRNLVFNAVLVKSK